MKLALLAILLASAAFATTLPTGEQGNWSNLDQSAPLPQDLVDALYYEGFPIWGRDPLTGFFNGYLVIWYGGAVVAQQPETDGAPVPPDQIAFYSWHGTPALFELLDAGSDPPSEVSDPVAVPEPGALALVGLGLVGLAGMRRKGRIRIER